MKQITVIGDIHGRNAWKQVFEREKDICDKFIFMGDYFDSIDVSFENQLNNFRDIIQLKRDNPDKVILLFGNHDFHYLGVTRSCYSGYQLGSSSTINIDLWEALREDLFQMCFKQDNCLFTHAGVSKTWWRNNVHKEYSNDVESEIVDTINDLFKYQPRLFDFTSRGYSMTGNEECQTPIWIRPEALSVDGLPFIHVVGHTQIPQPEYHKFENGVGIIRTDSLFNKNYVNLIFDNNQLLQFNPQSLNPNEKME